MRIIRLTLIAIGVIQIVLGAVFSRLRTRWAGDLR